MVEEIRINKYIAMCGVASRRNADVLIEDGKVFINGRRAANGDKVSNDDEVIVDGTRITLQNEKVVLALYKPIGVTVTEKDSHADKTVMDIIDYPIRLTYAGRLDKESEGLLLMTNDGDFINASMKCANNHEKEYIVTVDRELSHDELILFSKGIFIGDLNRKTKPCTIRKSGNRTYNIVLTEGMNRQIRRMFLEFNSNVIKLKRVRVINIHLGNLKPGEYRKLNDEEVKKLYSAVGIDV